MDSNTHQGYQLQHQQQQQPNSGLLRFRSAPSSLLTNLTPVVTAADSAVNKGNLWEGGESERLVSYGSADSSNDTASPSFQEFEDNTLSSKAVSRMNSQKGYAGGLPPHYPRHGFSSTSSSAMDGSYGLVGSIGIDHETPQKGFGSNLLRQSSSPAGLFSNNISFQNGFATMKGVENYDAVNGGNGELSPSINRLKNQLSFSSRSPSSLGMLSQISEIGSEDIGTTSPDDARQGGSNGDARHYGHGFPYDSWNDTPQLSENLTGLKRGRNSTEKLFCGVQNEDLGNQVNILSHHLSLPKTSSEMIGMERLLQFPDSVPCKIRAKRGCATHPRSIAERVRRTRISERMRKLQELVPNMDKLGMDVFAPTGKRKKKFLLPSKWVLEQNSIEQTNTADMLDLAVEYIKDLQNEFKTLSEKRANCKCTSMQKADTNQIA